MPDARKRAVNAFADWGDGCISTTEFRLKFEEGFPELEFTDDYDVLLDRIRTSLDIDA